MTPPPRPAAALGDGHAFGAFVIAGGLAAGVNVLSRYLLSFWLSFEPALVVAYLFGMTTAFLLNRAFVFERSGASWVREYGRFAMVNVVAFCQVLIVSEVLVRMLFPAVGLNWHAAEIGHAIGVASPIVSSFYAHKHFSFSRKPPEASA